MTEYVVYMREQDGKIERVDYAFANYPEGPVQFYVYEEQAFRHIFLHETG